MATIKITDIETLWSELSDKDSAVVSGGLCSGGGYPVYDPELGRRVCDGNEGESVPAEVGFPTVAPPWNWE